MTEAKSLTPFCQIECSITALNWVGAYDESLTRTLVFKIANDFLNWLKFLSTWTLSIIKNEFT